MKKEVAVVIGDLIRSRKIAGRAGVQRRLRKTLERINRKYRNSILARLMLTRGDEFEGVLKDARACYAAFEDIEREIYPVGIRGGIGVGKIDTEFSEVVTEMDGPAFHLAREALAKVRGKKSGLLVCSGNREVDKPLNSILSLYWAVKDGWTARQREVANFYLSRGAPTHAEVAKHFRVSQPAITKILSAAHVEAVSEAREFLTRRLSLLGGR
jgi:hypothetical protein